MRRKSRIHCRSGPVKKKRVKGKKDAQGGGEDPSYGEELPSPPAPHQERGSMGSTPPGENKKEWGGQAGVRGVE